MAKQLLGKEVTDALNAKLIERANALKEKGVVPTLGIVRVGENPSDLSYEKGATKRAELIGINVQKFVPPEDAAKEDLRDQRQRRHPRRSDVPSAAEASQGRPE